MLNNRELAVAIWLLIVLIWALLRDSVRHSLGNVLKAFFVKKIFIPIVCMLLYVFLMVLLFIKVGFWDTSAIKDTIFWTFGVAFITLVNLNDVVAEEHFFRKIVLDDIKKVLILEFILNLYAFNLALELVIVPIVSLIVMLNTVASLKPEYKRVKVLLDYVLGIFGLALIVFTIREIVVDFQNFATLKNLRDFLLPPFFTIAFFPFVYLMALFMQYETLFVRMNLRDTKSDLAKYAKRKIVVTCHLNLRKLNRISKIPGLLRVSNRNDVLAIIKKAQNK
jgi:hypothetical protein